MDTWQNFGRTLARGFFGSPRRALTTFIVATALAMVFVPSVGFAIWQTVISPVLLLCLIAAIIWVFFVKPLVPKRTSKK